MLYYIFTFYFFTFLQIYLYVNFFFKNGDTSSIRVKIHPATDSELNSPKEDSLLLHSKTPRNEIEEYVSGDVCLYGVSLR